MSGSLCLCFVFFKQKTAYEMRISDWSSDVCSSDLRRVDDILEVRARFQQLARNREEIAVLEIAQHDAVVAVVEDEALADGVDRLLELLAKIGRASCRERVCQYV